jgi:hypothetical protein
VTVRFEPTTPGVHDCTVETGTALCSDVSCTGEGELPPECDVSPTFLDFGTVLVGETAELAFTITNIGGGSLEGTVSESCPDYSIVSGAGAYSLGAGQSRVVTVRFAPADAGTTQCVVETGTETCSDVSCQGIGEAVSSIETTTPLAFTLAQNRPDPFSGTTSIAFSLDRETSASLRIFDISGTLIRTLVDARLPAGSHQAVWDGLDDRGKATPQGLYFYRLEAEGRSITKKAIFLRGD